MGTVTASSPMVPAELADALRDAESSRSPIEPLTAAHPDLSTAQAYVAQRINVDRRVARGAVIRGRKLGVTSRASQAVLGVTEPTFGTLLSDMFVEDGDEVSADGLIAPRVEAELAFVMSRELTGPGLTSLDAARAIDCVVPVIEIGDSRIAGWRIRVADSVADNASSARVVLGPGPVPLTRGLDVTHLGVLFCRNGTVIDSGAGAAVLGNPIRAVAWAANKLAEFGDRLRAGDLVLSGALHRMVPARPGDLFTARFARLGDVSVRFTGARR